MKKFLLVAMVVFTVTAMSLGAGTQQVSAASGISKYPICAYIVSCTKKVVSSSITRCIDPSTGNVAKLSRFKRNVGTASAAQQVVKNQNAKGNNCIYYAVGS